MTPLEHAISQLGVREATGRNDGIPATRYNDGEAKPWCASFVRWCFEQAGAPLPGKRWLLPSVAHMERALQGAQAWASRELAEPAPGDIIFFADRGGSDAGPGRHVGIVERVQGARVHTIEGNLGDAVRRTSHALASRRITGYGRWPTEEG